MGDLIDRVLLIVLIGGPLFGLGMSGLLWVLARIPRRAVKTSAPVLDVTAGGAPLPMAVRPRTDGPDSPDGQPSVPAMWAPTREQQLTLFRLLREYGVPREKARPALKAAGWVLSNDVWAQAAPPEPEPADDLLITPYAGRITRRHYYPGDADMEYQAPA